MRVIAFVVTVLTAASARADSPGRHRGLERDGFMVGVSLGPGAFSGLGDLKDHSGGGPMLTLRVGTRATETTEWLLELGAGAFADEAGSLPGNQHSFIVVGAQRYVRSNLWLRGGPGVATYRERRDGEVVDGSRRTGFALMSGVGYDLLQRGRFALDVEWTISFAVYSGAWMTHSSLALAANWY